MRTAKMITLNFGVAIVLSFAFIAMRGNHHFSCESPIVLDLKGGGFFEDRFNEVVLALGGLPKSGIDDFGLVMNRWGGELKMKDESNVSIPPIHPVKAWQIDLSSVTVTQFNHYWPLDDSSKYSYRFNVHVTYADGDTAALQLSSWSYGTAACPILISTGVGEPGHLKYLPQKAVDPEMS